MTEVEIHIVIVLRKILALLNDEDFNSVMYNSKAILLKNIQRVDEPCFLVIKRFVEMGDLKKKGNTEFEIQPNSELMETFINSQKELVAFCQQKHIDINFEINQLRKVWPI
jgi:hypothetical protein